MGTACSRRAAASSDAINGMGQGTPGSQAKDAAPADAKATAPSIGAGGPGRGKIGSGGPRSIGSGAPRPVPPAEAKATADNSANAGIWGKSQAAQQQQKWSQSSDAPVARACGDMQCALQDCFAEEAELQRRRDANHARADAVVRSICPEARLVKLRSINGRFMVVVDGAVSEGVRSQLFECLQADAFKRTEFARPDTREFRHQIVEYNPHKMRTTKLYLVIEQLLKALFPPTPARPSQLDVYRIYTNAVMYGDVAFVHRDSSDDSHVTVLAYPNPEWKPEFGGETVFYTEDGEVADAVEPRPGRLCIFHGYIMHKGSPPSRLFWGSRYTTAFKCSPEDDRRGSGGASAAEPPNPS